MVTKKTLLWQTIAKHRCSMCSTLELHLQAILHCLEPRLPPPPTHIQNSSLSSSRVKELSRVCPHISPSPKFILRTVDKYEVKENKSGNI